jgi:bacteriophage N4 adsorption protein B
VVHVSLAAFGPLDRWILASLIPLAIYIALSGLDDLFVDAAWLWTWARGRRSARRLPPSMQLESASRRRIAIFVPLWREQDVIADMLAHNIAAIRYNDYDFFAGAYPNDAPTLAALAEIERRFPNVHVGLCPHDGPTSKADCLNWIYQRMLLYEQEHDIRYEIVVTHDAEDIIHPQSLAWIDGLAAEYDFIQVPVLALGTPLRRWTHGVYCDEFAEFQSRDLPVRSRMGAFVPSAGVGTGYSRRGLEALANRESGRVFDPACLTEDYENGYRLKRLGFRQIFLPIARSGGALVATREYFPQHWRAAVRQRTRWVIGIALQGWERHGWEGGPIQKYWLWRDRKGLIGNPVSVLTNVLAVYGIATGLWTRIAIPGTCKALFAVTLILQLHRNVVRIGCSARIYGLGFALLAPLRAIWANGINSVATARALVRYGRARCRGEPLAWSKTEHVYAAEALLARERRRIGEILVSAGCVSKLDLERAASAQPAGTLLGQHLLARGMVGERQLYAALSVQRALPFGDIPADRVPASVARALPADVIRRLQVVPFKVEYGNLHVAGPNLPDEAIETALREHTSLRIRFHLVTPAQFAELERRLR